MIENYLNQSASWQAKTGDNSYGEPTYGAAATISCRVEDIHRLTRDTEGVQVVSETTLFCLEAVRANDLITYNGQEYVALRVADQPRLDGTINHREVYL